MKGFVSLDWHQARCKWEMSIYKHGADGRGSFFTKEVEGAARQCVTTGFPTRLQGRRANAGTPVKQGVLKRRNKK